MCNTSILNQFHRVNDRISFKKFLGLSFDQQSPDHLNKIEDGIMRKATTGAELTEYETARNKAISKVRYIVEQYFGLSHLYNKAYRARFPQLIKNAIDVLFRQMAFNLSSFVVGIDRRSIRWVARSGDRALP